MRLSGLGNVFKCNFVYGGYMYAYVIFVENVHYKSWKITDIHSVRLALVSGFSHMVVEIIIPRERNIGIKGNLYDFPDNNLSVCHITCKYLQIFCVKGQLTFIKLYTFNFRSINVIRSRFFK